MRLPSRGHNICSLFLLAGILSFSASELPAAPLILNDAALDRITAGNTGSDARKGIIVGNSAVTIVEQTVGMSFGDHVQDQARGINLVNSSGSAVANGINLWDGQGVEGTGLQVAQVNRVEQHRPQFALISEYSRSADEQRFQVDTRRNENHEEQIHAHSEVKDIYLSQQISDSVSSTNVDTSLDLGIGAPDSELPFFALETNVGHGIAVAGQLDAHFDGGSAEFDSSAQSSIETEPEINAGDYFSASVALRAEAGLTLSAEIDLPTLDVQVNGAGCGVVLGSCQAAGVLSEVTQEVIDNSRLDIRSETSTTNNLFTESISEQYRSPFSLGKAEAEYIVVDDSSLIVESDETLELSGSAQKNAKGMNLVNAVGSSVSNVVNVARSRQLNYRGELMLTQFNFVLHGQQNK